MEHFMGHCFNSLKYSGTTKQQSVQQKYQFAKIKAAHHTSDDIAKVIDVDGQYDSEEEFYSR